MSCCPQIFADLLKKCNPDWMIEIKIGGNQRGFSA